MSEDSDTLWFGSKAIYVWGLSLLFLIAFGVTMWAHLGPWWQDLNTQGVEHSYTFVQTKKELLIHLRQDYLRLEAQQQLHKNEPEVVAALEAQKTATRDRIRSEAATLPPNEVPPEVRSFL